MSFRPKRGKPEYLEGSCARPELVLILAPSLKVRKCFLRRLARYVRSLYGVTEAVGIF